MTKRWNSRKTWQGKWPPEKKRKDRDRVDNTPPGPIEAVFRYDGDILKFTPTLAITILSPEGSQMKLQEMNLQEWSRLCSHWIQFVKKCAHPGFGHRDNLVVGAEWAGFLRGNGLRVTPVMEMVR